MMMRVEPLQVSRECH